MAAAVVVDCGAAVVGTAVAAGCVGEAVVRAVVSGAVVPVCGSTVTRMSAQFLNSSPQPGGAWGNPGVRTAPVQVPRKWPCHTL